MNENNRAAHETEQGERPEYDLKTLNIQPIQVNIYSNVPTCTEF